MQKAILDKNEQTKIVFSVIDLYNDMLADLEKKNSKFHYVNLRPILDPQKDWVNELHLTNSAYARSAELIHKYMTPLL